MKRKMSAQVLPLIVAACLVLLFSGASCKKLPFLPKIGGSGGGGGSGVPVVPSITTPPASQSVVVGQTATFGVTVIGAGPITFQWFKNGISIAGAASTTYTTPPTVTGDNGAQFTVKATNQHGFVISSPATLTVTGVGVVATIVTQPSAQSVVAGSTATFSVGATGTAPLNYQWQRNLVNIAGANGSSFTTPATTLADSGAQYRVIVANWFGSVTSNTVVLTVGSAGAAPAIVTQPANQTVVEGTPATFTVAVSGTVPFSYQWQKNAVNIGGATGSSYTTPATTLGDNGAQFRVIVTNAAGNVTSNAATLTVTSAGTAPSITTQPSAQSVTVGSPATFTVAVSGTAPFSYQWQKNSVNIAGATASSYTTPATTLADNGAQFRVIVTNASGTVTSNQAVLTVTSIGVAPSIIVQPAPQSVLTGTTATFSVAAGGTAPFTYQWQKNSVNIAGATVSSYTTPATTLGDSGTQYRVLVTNSYGSVLSIQALLTVTGVGIPPTIVTQPVNQTIYVGQTATFTVTVSGTAPFSYQWYIPGHSSDYAIPGATGSSYSILGTAPQFESYRVRVTNAYGVVYSNYANLSVFSPPGPPTINLSSNNLTFSATLGGSDPAAQTVDLTNVGSGGSSLNWTFASDAAWLNVSPSAGSTPTGPVPLTLSPKLGNSPAWLAGPTTTGTLSARETMSYIWTGTEMILWGGANLSGQLGDGARYNPATNTWAPVASLNAPPPRNTHTAVWTGTRMIIWGGMDAGSNYLNDGRIYDPATDSWSVTPISTVNAPSARRFHSAVWTGTEMIVWGGSSGGAGLNDGYRYNPATDTWVATAIAAANAPSGRTAHTAIWTGTEMVIWGGTSTLAETDALGDGGRYNPSTNTWSATPISTTGAPVARFGHTAAWTGTEMIVWAGSSDLATRRNDGARYDPATNSWLGALSMTNVPAIRHHHAAVWTGTKMIVWGGWWGAGGSGHVWWNDGGIYAPPAPLGVGVYTGHATVSDPASSNLSQTITVTLTVASVTPPSIGLSPTVLNFATPTGINPAAQTADVTNPVAGSLLNWSATASHPWLAVTPMSGVTTSGTDTLGIQAMSVVPEQWKAVTSMGYAPSQRYTHSAVWTGSEMIIWGGWDTVLLNDGHRYNPAGNAWSPTPISTVNAPSARREHAAVWTGTRMIIWGGDTGASLLDNGGLYDPVANSWSAMSTTNAPTPRRVHSAVWTGTEMIVWGGIDAIGVTNTGARYNPATDTWSAVPTATAGAPSARGYHAAVWTGSEMIVWGGDTPGGCVNTGGRYNPSSNTWSGSTPTTTGAPSARRWHSAVWTGTEMIVWGGSVNPPYSNTGGRYNPATDSWSAATTLANAPAGRAQHAAVWTGSEMIVWGGAGNGSNLNDGQRYQPPASLSAGFYVGTITITDPLATNNPRTVTVNLTVGAAVAPAIALAPTTLNFVTVIGTNPAAQTTNLTNPTASSTLNWTASPNKPWLQVSPISGLTTTGTSVLTVNAIASQSETWIGSLSTTNAPSSRENPSGVWTGKEFIVWGGYDGARLNTGARYNPATDTWTATSTLNAPSARELHSAVWTGSRMIVWGGRDGVGVKNDGGVYNPATDSWSLTPIAATNAPSARRSHSAVWTGTKMLVWGGYNEVTNFGDGRLYDPGSNTWSVTAMSTTSAPTARRGASAIWTGSQVVIWGGYDGAYVDTGAFYNPATDSWTGATATSGAPSGRLTHAAVWTGSEMIVWGGDPAGFSNTGARFDPATNQWLGATILTSAPPPTRSMAYAWTGREMLVWGGYTGAFVNTGYRYCPPINLAAGSYSGTLTVADPLATNNPQTVTVNLTVGAAVAPAIALAPTTLNFATTPGVNPAAQTSDLTNPTAFSTLNWTATSDQPWLAVSPNNGITTTGTSVLTFQPTVTQAEQWTGGMTLTGVPSARESATAVWTGSEMIVWGGWNGAIQNSGGIYSPATNTWRGMSITGAPAVCKHAAVWTGSKMVVWGGDPNGAGVVNTGALYDPGTDSWAPMSTVNAPSARRHPTAVWTGTEMMVWGGDDLTFANTGGRYNPATDTWSITPLSTVNAPTGRFGHSAVWTGSEMIIWGGYGGGPALGDGGRYNAATDTWSTTPISTVSAPTARYHHTAVWSGGRMIVWGGSSDAGTRLNTGTLYDPATNSWTGTTTLTAAPIVRHSHASVWTGNSMIVWGGWWGSGVSGNVFLNDGGIYQQGTSLAAGTYTAQVTVSDPAATNNPQVVTVNLTVASGTTIPAIGLSSNALNFTCAQGGSPSAQAVNVTNAGDPGSTLNWTAAGRRVWDQNSPFAGTVSTGSNLLIVQPIATQTESWQPPISLTNAPAARANHSLVWTGKEMIAWGGETGYGIYNADGGRYNPATDSWSTTAISSTNVPTARVNHSAVWTGKEMILWGGQTDYGAAPLNEGRIYNPVTNVWSYMSSANGPGALAAHSAIWTGNEMIVWGGTDGTTIGNTGRRYNPVADSWSPVGTSTDRAPAGRLSHAAVWTGQYMIVWGGDNASAFLNTGGIYDPATDTWLGATSTTGAPSARGGMAVVWDGAEMIIYSGNPAFGSNGPDGYSFDGKRYNPVSNTWAGMTTTGATTKTRCSKAVWTGREMIVFGGFDGFNFQQFGHRYKPAIDLSEGVYTDTITVADPAASNNTQAIAVTLTVTGSPDPVVITTPPAGQTVYLGERPVFFAGATGSPTLTYQWQKNSVNIPGATGFYYRAPAAVLGDEGATFSVIVTNGVGSATSAAATLHVNSVGVGPVVTQHPAGQSVTAGQTAAFLVAATGSPTLTYQWQKNSVDIPGATGAYYVTPPTVLGDNGANFRVVVTNGFGSAVSLPATLTVTP